MSYSTSSFFNSPLSSTVAMDSASNCTLPSSQMILYRDPIYYCIIMIWPLRYLRKNTNSDGKQWRKGDKYIVDWNIVRQLMSMVDMCSGYSVEGEERTEQKNFTAINVKSSTASSGFHSATQQKHNSRHLTSNTMAIRKQHGSRLRWHLQIANESITRRVPKYCFGLSGGPGHPNETPFVLAVTVMATPLRCFPRFLGVVFCSESSDDHHLICLSREFDSRNGSSWYSLIVSEILVYVYASPYFQSSTSHTSIVNGFFSKRLCFVPFCWA